MAGYSNGYDWGNNGYQYQNQPSMGMNNTPMYNRNQPQASSMRADWAQGEGAARMYPTTPGVLTLLMDSEMPVLYVKMCDQFGRPCPLEVYDLVKRDTSLAQIPQIPQSQWTNQNPSSQANVQYVQPDMTEYVKNSDLENKVNELVHRAMGGQNGGNSSYGNPPEGNQR